MTVDKIPQLMRILEALSIEPMSTMKLIKKARVNNKDYIQLVDILQKNNMIITKIQPSNNPQGGAHLKIRILTMKGKEVIKLWKTIKKMINYYNF